MEAGWYPHPDKPNIRVWWDGENWGPTIGADQTPPLIDAAHAAAKRLGIAPHASRTVGKSVRLWLRHHPKHVVAAWLCLALVVVGIVVRAATQVNCDQLDGGNVKQAAKCAAAANSDSSRELTAADIDCRDPSVSQELWVKFCQNAGQGAQASDAPVVEEEEYFIIPNFVGTDALAVEQASSSYRGQLNLSMSTQVGYDYSIACRVQKQYTVLDQFPRAGTRVKKGRATSLTLKIDC